MNVAVSLKVNQVIVVFVKTVSRPAYSDSCCKLPRGMSNGRLVYFGLSVLAFQAMYSVFPVDPLCPANRHRVLVSFATWSNAILPAQREEGECRPSAPLPTRPRHSPVECSSSEDA